jgi:hypothetical protein
MQISNTALSSISFLTISLLCGLPIWWKTTTVQRFPLPRTEISNLPEPSNFFSESSESTIRARIKQPLVISILTADIKPKAFHENLVKHTLHSLNEKWQGLVNFEVLVELLSYDEELFSDVSEQNLADSFNYLESNILSPDTEKNTAHVVVVLKETGNLGSENSEYHIKNWGTLVFALDINDIGKISVDTISRYFGINEHLDQSTLHKTVISSTIHNSYKSAHFQLTSLLQTLDSVKNIVINEKVASKIETAVGLLNKKEQSDSLEKNTIQVYENVLNAEELINSAATDESLLGLLYFPEDQKFGIYVPLFLPVGLSLIGSIKPLVEYFKTMNSQKTKND